MYIFFLKLNLKFLFIIFFDFFYNFSLYPFKICYKFLYNIFSFIKKIFLYDRYHQHNTNSNHFRVPCTTRCVRLWDTIYLMTREWIYAEHGIQPISCTNQPTMKFSFYAVYVKLIFFRFSFLFRSLKLWKWFVVMIVALLLLLLFCWVRTLPAETLGRDTIEKASRERVRGLSQSFYLFGI